MIFEIKIAIFHSSPRIQEDYNKTVLPRKADFENNLAKQLAEILNTDISNIQDLRTWEGSVEVKATIKTNVSESENKNLGLKDLILISKSKTLKTEL